MPPKASAVVFAVPDPISAKKRPDVAVTDGEHPSLRARSISRTGSCSRGAGIFTC
jgi:hypothetical protein